jgi:hypothetical protein
MTTYPDVYDSDVDEMTAGALAALAEVRQRLVAHYAHDPHASATVAGVVDEYAYELVENVTEEDEE